MKSQIFRVCNTSVQYGGKAVTQFSIVNDGKLSATNKTLYDKRPPHKDFGDYVAANTHYSPIQQFHLAAEWILL